MDMTPDTRCPGCFTAKGRVNPCPHCGYDETAARGPLPLPHRTLLHGQFVVGRVLGKPGGFGITYLGWDRHLEMRVAIKEYLPRDLAGRASDGATVAMHSQEEGEAFRYGLEQFLREARTLAQLDHPNIVRVRYFFEANGTAYLVMDYYQGLSLAEYLDQQGGRLPEEQARQLMLPILDGLRAVHAKGFLHRDIKPQNIYLARLESGGVRPILLDFGTARQAMGEHSRSLSVVLTPGYAPFEQYHRKGKQGPWTDVYAAAAVLYRMVTGIEPPEATERREGDELKPAAQFGVSHALSSALAAGLAIAPEARPQTVLTFQVELRSEAIPAPSGPVPAPTANREEQSSPSILTSRHGLQVALTKSTPSWPWYLYLFFFVLALWLVYTLIYVHVNGHGFVQQGGESGYPNIVKAPSERYQFIGEDQDIVVDIFTKLEWQRCNLGQTWKGATCAGKVREYKWDEALRIAPAGWRLPTKDELVSLVYCSSGMPAYWKTASESCEGAYSRPTIWGVVFPNTPEDWFWSSSPSASDAHGAWGVSFGNGLVNNYNKGYTSYVRLVRGGG